jgi:hypothetical protein
MTKITTQSTVASALLVSATATFAHDGHGLTGAHWHATDTVGFMVVAVMAAVAIWLSRK